MKNQFNRMTLFSLISAGLLTGCVMAAKYTKPEIADEPALHRVRVKQSPSEAIAAVHLYGLSPFYTVEYDEREKGRMVLTFQTREPAGIATGGLWQAASKHSAYSYSTNEGDYLSWLTGGFGATATGRVDIQATPTEDGETEVEVNVTYRVNLPQGQSNPALVWSFSSGNCATLQVQGTALGTDDERTICPNHRIERSLLHAASRAGE